jgi:hypothetical protein
MSKQSDGAAVCHSLEGDVLGGKLHTRSDHPANYTNYTDWRALGT